MKLASINLTKGMQFLNTAYKNQSAMVMFGFLKFIKDQIDEKAARLKSE